jgi:AcrR family transcriptional regulator
MDDIAERLGVSKGTIYRAVDSKEILFAAVIAWADTPDDLPADGLASTHDVAAVASAVASELAGAVAGLELAAIVADRKRLRSANAFGDEIERITIGEISDLAEVWFGDGRYALVDLWHDYLTLRSAHLTDDVDPAILARTIVETVTTWAVKMPWDPAPRPYPDDTAAACATMIRHLLVGPAR